MGALVPGLRAWSVHGKLKMVKLRTLNLFAPSVRDTQVEGLEAVSVGYNSTGADDSCEWFVTFVDSPGNVDQVL